MRTYKCPQCGSKNVLFDATARWDEDAQELVLSGVNDFMNCEDCEHESDGGFESSELLDDDTAERNDPTRREEPDLADLQEMADRDGWEADL